MSVVQNSYQPYSLNFKLNPTAFSFTSETGELHHLVFPVSWCIVGDNGSNNVFPVYLALLLQVTGLYSKVLVHTHVLF